MKKFESYHVTLYFVDYGMLMHNVFKYPHFFRMILISGCMGGGPTDV